MQLSINKKFEYGYVELHFGELEVTLQADDEEQYSRTYICEALKKDYVDSYELLYHCLCSYDASIKFRGFDIPTKRQDSYLEKTTIITIGVLPYQLGMLMMCEQLEVIE